jgi:hypothetical protein
MPRFFAVVCLQKMRNGMGKLTIQQPVRHTSSIL